MPLIPLTNPDDPRLDLYRDIRDRVLRANGLRFMAEGHMLFERLLASGLEVESACISAKRLPQVQSIIPPDLPVYVLDEQLHHQVVGYRLHTGVLAIGIRKPWPTLDDVMAGATDPVTFVACPFLKESENLGSIIRTCCAFGVHALILGPECCDPYYRRCLRVSMGNAFKLTIIRTDDFHRTLEHMHTTYGFERYATILDPNVIPLQYVQRADRSCILLGHEVDGLDERTIAQCDHRITMKMHDGVDSLSVGVAAGVVLHQFCRG